MGDEKNESWNKKRIFIAAFLIVALVAGGYFFKTRVLGDKVEFFTKNPSGSVKGVSAKEEKKNKDTSVNIDLPKVLKEKINSLKQEVSSLDVVEVASSSPQIQKIINDIKALEQYPTNQARELCKQICSF